MTISISTYHIREFDEIKCHKIKFEEKVIQFCEMRSLPIQTLETEFVHYMYLFMLDQVFCIYVRMLSKYK